MSASHELVADFKSAHAMSEEKLTTFLRERVFNKNTSIHASVHMRKRLTFARMPRTEKPAGDLKARAAEMERSALKAVIDLVEVSHLVDLTELLEHRVVEECVALFNSNGTYRKTQKSMLIQGLSATCRPTGALHCSRRHGDDLEDGRSISGRSTDPRWDTIQVCTRCHPSSLPAMLMLNLSSV